MRRSILFALGFNSILFGQLSFSAADIATSPDKPLAVFVADMDNDGDMDIVSASRNDDAIAWYENDGAANPSWTAADITISADGASGVFVADMDNDGDMDIVSASRYDDAISWYENDGAANPSWTAENIATSADGAYSVFVADMDNDGDVDIVSASIDDNTIAWYENNGAADPSWSATDISTSADNARSVFAADMDNDGDMDIVSASKDDDAISWYENDGAANPTWTAAYISTSADGAFSVFAADMDNDGDMDIVSASEEDDAIAWYENDGNANPTWTAADIATSADGAQSVFAADMDNDGDMDIVSASYFDDTIAWYENDGNANPTWTAADIATSADGAASVFAADMDSDGDMDIVSTGYDDNTIAWYENTTSTAFEPSFTAADISTSATGASNVSAADMDNDGDMDILSASANNDEIRWYENDGAINPSWSAITISSAADYVSGLHHADLDNDGDMDVISASYSDDKLAWYENDGAADPSFTTRNISTSVNGAYDVYTADLDNDGDMDILVTAHSDDKIYWYENDGAADPSFSQVTVVSSVDEPACVYAADMDNDGDIDVIGAIESDDQIAWYENDGAADPSFTARSVTTSADGANGVFAVDIDRDGDMDLISSSHNDDKIAWYENDGAVDPSFTTHTIATSADNAQSVFAADMDNDGDIDIISGSYNDDAVSIYLNDGAADPSFSASDINTSADGLYDVHVADMDNDGDMDVLSASFTDATIAWYENSPMDLTAPSIPTGLVATPGNAQVVLTWTANGESDLASYKVYGGTSATPTTLLSTVTSGTETYTHSSLTNGTTYYYRISAVDNAGNESDKTADVISLPHDTDGSYSLSFDGVNDYLEGSASSDLTLTNDFSMSWWVNTSSNQMDYIFSLFNSSTTVFQYAFSMDSRKVYWLEPNATFEGNGAQYSNSEASSGIWTHFVCTYDGSTFNIYKDGTVDASRTVNASLASGTFDTFRIGVSHGLGNYFTGYLDEVVIWNDALTTAEVTALYNSGVPLAASSNSGDYTSSSNVQSYWRFAENTGSTAYDLSGNGNHGTNNGTTYSTDVPSDIFAPATPTGLVATPGNAQAVLTWTANSVGDLASYKVYGGTSASPTTLLSTVTSGQTYTHTSLTNGTLYYYRISAVDNAGNESDKTSDVFAMPHDTDGSYSLSFDGVNDYVDLGTGFNLPDYTIEVKLKISDSGEGSIIAKSVGANADASSWKIMQAGGIVQVGVDGDGSVPVITGNNIADNNWHTVTAQNTGEESMYLHVDGVYLGGSSGYYNSTSTQVNIGAQMNGPYFFNEMLIDEIRISEISRYGASAYDDGDWPSDNNTVALYKFNEGAGTTLYDLSGNGNHGTINGASWSSDVPSADVTAPATPTNLVATPGNAQVVLTWTANSESDLASYKVYGGTSSSPTTLLSTISAGTETYTHTSLTNGTLYYYRISAVDNNGNESSKSSDVSTSPKPQKYTVKTDGSGDYTVIQTAIDATTDADTVLVYAGTYTENINYNGKNIVVGSLYLTTSDTSYISSTIIDGNESGSVVTFENGETSSAKLVGFTIQNGYYQKGGGILINGNGGENSGTSATINNIVLKNNLSTEYGGGIAVELGGNIILQQSKLIDNQSSGAGQGGGISVWASSTAIIENTLIANNTGGHTGGVFCKSSSATLVNTTLIGNTGVYAGTSSNSGGDLTILNCILNNSGSEVNITTSNSSVTVNNSGINGGESAVYNNWGTLNWGATNIDTDPLFVDAASGNYRLSDYSPAIGAGTATGAPTTDIEGNIRPNPAGSNPDMGAYENALGSPSAPPVPTNLAATVGNGVVNLSWTGNDYATSYSVYRSTTSGSGFTAIATGLSTVSYANTGLTNETTYYYKVSATGAGGESDLTAEIGAKPKAQKYTVKTDDTGDYTVIQAAIDATTDADTVLVYAGTYTENINYNGKNIVVGSLYLTTQDTSYISSTIIDGNQAGSVVTITSGEDSTAVLSGFTVTNGSAVTGGGILCYNSASPTLKNLIISGNSASSGGGGVWFGGSSHPYMANVTISGNYSTGIGGGICLDYSNLSLVNVTVIGNSAGFGGGIFCNMGIPSLVNVTVIGNSASSGGGGVYAQDSNPSLINTIVFGNSPQEIYTSSSTPSVSYSLVEGGYEGTGNIDSNPLFTDAANGDYRLSNYSPAIGAGTVTGAPTTDIDGNIRPNPAGSNPDMGAYENALGSPSAPPTPTNLAATVGNGVVNLSWTGNDYATSYSVYRSTTSGSGFTAIVTGLSTTSYQNTGLTNGTTYYYKVSATGSGGESNLTSVIGAIPWASAGNDVSGIISGDQTWTLAGSPFVATGNILVSDGVTLTIEAEVTVKFDAGISLQINGELIAQGTSSNKITFTSNLSSPAAGDWGGIKFTDSSNDAVYDEDGNYISGSIIQYSIIKYSGGSVDAAVIIDSAHPYILNNLITKSSSQGIYATNLGGDFSNEGLFFIKNNTISNNDNTGIRIDVANVELTIRITNNTIINNTSSSGDAGGIRLTMGGASPAADAYISNNIIAGNTGYEEGGIYIQYWTFSLVSIKNNSFYNNYSSQNESGNAIRTKRYHTSYGTSVASQIDDNIFSNHKGNNLVYFDVGNVSSYLDIDLNDNNYIGNQTDYVIYQSGGASVDAESNYWDTTTDSEIQTKIYDWNDDGTLGIVDYDPYLTAPNIDAPISPPANVAKQISGSDVILTWVANPESDVAGYKIHYGNFTGYSYTTNTDLGNVTTYTLSGVSIDSSIAITAYDGNIDGTDDQVEGYQSWFSVAAPDETPPSIPTGLAATPGDAQVVLTWTANSESDLASHKVYGGPSPSPTTVLSTVSAGTETYTNTSLTNGTTYYYRISAVDESGNESDKTSDVYAMPHDTGGSYSLSFDGNNDYVNVGNTSSLTINGDITVSAWVYFDEFPTYTPTVISKVTDGSTVGYGIEKKQLQSKLSFWVGDGTDFIEVYSGELSATTWYHVVGTNDGTNSKIYINGTLAATAAQGNPAGPTGDLKMGIHSTQSQSFRYWDGNIDEVAIWNEALTASEITAIYNSGVPLAASSNSGDYTSSANVQGYWRFGENTGSTAYDISGNGNHGTINGASLSTNVPYAGPVYYVATSGSDDGTGSSSLPFATIQKGIDESSSGDTVLVAAGTYTENINYNGKNIVVGSLFLTTADTSYISSTIIDGNQAGSVVIFESSETSSAVLTGLTIQNGTAVAGYFDSGPFSSGVGGGILCNGASPILDNLIIRNNTANEGGTYGGGIYATNGNISIQNCVVRNNSAGYGGGVWIHGSSGSIKNSVIYDNTSGGSGTSVGIASSSYTTSVINTVIYNNNARGLKVVDGAGVDIVNSIIKNNVSSADLVEIEIGSNATASIRYSMIPNGQNAINSDGTLTWGSGNIDVDPMFVDTANGNYHLLASSMLINAGHPDSTDSDGTRADIGAYPYLNTYSGPMWFVSGNGNDTTATGEGSNSFRSIQAAINFASDGDEVNVASGHYFENINFRGRAIVVKGTGNSIIDGGGNGTVVTFESGEDTTTVLSGFTIQNGTAVAGYFDSGPFSSGVGGGILCNGASPILDNLIIRNNTANEGGTYGGGIYATNGNISIQNCVVRNNSAGYGGGVWIHGSSGSIKNSVIYDNTSGDTGTSVGIASSGYTTSVINTVIYNNNARGLKVVDGAGVDIVNSIIKNNVSSADLVEIEIGSNATASISYSMIPNGQNAINSDGTLTWGSGNIDSDPLFVDADNGDYRLSDYSPAIGAGTATGAPTTDITGVPNSRPIPSGSNPDMGAYENAYASQRPKAGTIADGLGTDVDWSNSSSSLSANWASFTDNDAVTYEYAVGTGTGNGSSGTNYSLSFDGVDDYVEYIAGVEPSGALSIGAWFKTTMTGTARIVSKTSSENIFFLMIQNDGLIRFNVMDGACVTTNSFNDGIWHNVIGSWDGSTVRIYVDGNFQVEGPATINTDYTNVNTAKPFIGTQDPTWENFDGLLDEIAVWEDALTATEITALYNSGNGLEALSNSGNYTSSSNLQGYWNFNEGSGTTLTDQTSNGNDGTINGATWSDDAPTITSSGSGAISDILSWTSNSSDTSVTVSGLNLTEGETYTFSARATDTDNQLSDTTTTDGVTIDTDAPVISSVAEGSATSVSSNTHSLSFDGVDDDVNIGDIDLVNHFTIISYVKPDYSLWNGDGGENDMIVGKGNSYMLGIHETWGLYAELLPTGSGTWVGSNSTYLQDNGISPTFLSENAWSQVVVTHDGQDLKVYVNGVIIYQITLSIDINQNDQSTVIGNCSSPHADRWLNGIIDETSIWNTALSQSEIQSYMSTSPTGSESGLVGYWNFNENTGSTLTDLSGNGNNGTIVGATWSDDVPATSTDGGDADYQNVADELIISWSGSDAGSGITTYEYAIGTSSDGSDITESDWNANGTVTSDTVSNLSLSDGQIYYLSVRATDAAGNVSDILTGDGITIDLTAPAGTTVSDGTEDDITYTGSDSTLSANWAAFTETVSGIAKYEYAIGTSSGGTDVLDWTDNSTNTSFTKTSLSLSNGTDYYMNVRATDLAGNVSPIVTSDGVIVDTAAPVAGSIIDGTDTDIDWTNSTTTLSTEWDGFSDGLSGIDYYEYAIGTTSGGTEIVDWTDSSIDTEELTLTNGTTYYVSGRATDNVGNVSTTVTTDGITVDTDAPVISSVVEGSSSTGDNYSLSFDGVDDEVNLSDDILLNDPESFTIMIYLKDLIYDLENYSEPFIIGTGEGGHWMIRAFPSEDKIKFSVYIGGTWHAAETTNEYDGAWHSLAAVYSRTDGQITLYKDGLLSQSTSIPTSSLYNHSSWDYVALGGGFGSNINAKLDELSIWNTALSQSEIQSYLTTSPTGSESGLVGYWNFNEGTGTTLTDQTSNGNNGTIVGATWSTDVPATSTGGDDGDYQNVADELIISWSGSDEVSGISTYEYALGTTSGGSDAIDWTSTGTSTADTVSNLSLSHGQIYYLSVRGTDAAGNVSDVLTGDGITIDLTAPAGTTVSDGMGNDIAYTGADSTLSGNWAAFTESVSGIAKYEYAIGTSSGGTDLLDWTDNSTITSITKTGLSLISGTAYYLSVRATDIAGNISDVISSNGVTVDLAGPIAGTIIDGTETDIDWDNSTTTLSADWTGFSDDISGIDNYEYAIGTTSGGTETLSWTNNTTNTIITKTGLTLSNGATYYISVRATDNVSNVSATATTDGITVDTDAPTIASVSEGSIEEDIDFQNSDSTLIISWSGEDNASGISTYEYALGSTFGGTDIVDWAANGTAIADTLSGLNLIENQTYYVSVRATDNAGNVSDIMMGDGILIDMTAPAVETILDGHGNDLIYTGSDSSLTANWSDFRDLVSGVAGYEIAVNDGNVYPWTWIGSELSHTIIGLDLEHAAFYTVNIRGTDNAGNVSETSSTDGITVDTESPGSVLNIVDDYYNEAGWDEGVQIQGTAADGNMQSGLSIVEVAIQDTSDNTYWSGNDWTSGEQWLQAEGMDSLYYELSADQLTDEHIYRVRSRSTDAVGNIQSDYGEDMFTYDITEPNTTLDIPDDYYNSAGWDAVTHIQGTAEDATSGSALVSVLIQRNMDNLYYGSDGWVDTVQWQLAEDTENWLYDFSSSNLDNGVTYSIQVRAEDVAGNVETSFASDNFTYDITPPGSDVLIERNFYNNINWSAANSISGTTSDSTSGLSTISISILRNSDNYYWGGTNWTSSENWIAPDGVASWTYGLNGNNLTNGVSYTISSRGQDIAGNIQAEYGQDAFTYDLTAPVVGQVNDGAEASDQDWSNSTTEMSANWSNFSDVTSGIVGYEYSIGSSPGGTDVLFWTENGTDTTFTEDVSLNSGDIYYVSVRATDAAENVSNVQTSDGITIDAVNPTVGDILEGSTEQDYDYQQNSTSLIISWAGSDALRSFRNGRDLSAFSVSLGTLPAATDVVDWVIVGNVNSYTFSGLNLQEAVTYYANVKALDLAGNESEVVSGDGITIDQSGPIPGSINDGETADIDWVNINYLSVGNWTGFTDSLSGIGEYEYSLGLSPGQTQVVSWTSSDLDTTITVSASLTEGPTYYANVRAVDSVSNVGDLVSSDGFGLDVSVPVTGNVYDGLADDLSWTNIIDSIWANWEGFSDLYSGISFYETAVGTSPGGQNTVAWISADTNITTSHAELSLEHGSTYYFSVRATDVVENVSSPGTSNGITIDTLSPVINLMAEASSEDPLFQGSDSSITLFWAADDDLSGIEHYDYALGSSAGESDLLAWTNAGTDLSITIGDLILEEGSKYYGSIRVYDQAGNMTEANGNGVTIDITAPDTGSGMDITDINNTADQSYTSSTTTLQASWDGFADNLSGIADYEYGVGSASLQTDIQDWISVDLDTFMLDNSFTLDNSDTYYISIRAIDSVGNVSDVISTDGIIADHEGPFGSLAIDGDSADIDRQNFTDIYSGRWVTFEDQLSGLAFYEVALYDSTSASYTIPWDSLGLDTLVEFIDLTLAQDHEYKLHIRGIDHVQNTGEITASDGVLIDQTAPMSPQNLVGFFSNERIYLTWESNLEPDLSHYIVYAGADSLQPVTVLQTGDTEAEAFLPEFSNDEDVFLHITATDIPGNESPISSRVSGIPQPAMVTRIEPDPSITLLKDDSQLSIHFSQPLTDIGTVTTASLAYSSMNLEATYSPEDTSIKIIVNDPWASLDTVTFAINNILDWAGSGTNEKTATFSTYLLGDYDNDFSVNVTDLSNFVTAWNNDDTSYELGPVTGTAPHFIPARNQLYDLRDIMVFTRMWHYSHETSAGRMLVYDPLGLELNIYQEGQRLVVDLPAETKAAHVFLSYPWDSKSITTPTDINSSEVIQLAYKPKELGQLVIEKAFMKNESVKNISFDINTLDRNNAVIELSYVAYDDSARMIASGRQTLDIVAIPDKYALHQNYPNPFNPTTTINYDVPKNGKIKMVIYDLMGREVRILMNHDLAAGYHTLTWDGKNNIGQIASAGLYFCQLRGQNYTKTIKMLLLK